MSCFINSKFIEGKGKEFNSINPSTQEIIWEGKTATKEQVITAISAARAAFKVWSKTSLEERLKPIERYIKILTEKQDYFANLISQEMGKNIIDADMEVKIMIGKYKTALDAYHQRTGSKEIQINDSLSLTKHKALGVCAVFGPYNFPGHIANGHILPALIAGNTIVYKPSNFVPKFSDEWMKLFQEAAFPDGVINMVQGEIETGEALSQSDDISAVFFTGSSKVGEILHRKLAGKLDKVLALELGGNNALVIDANYDIDKASDLSIASAFTTNGQRCTCTRRLILVDQDGSADKLLESLITKTKAITIDQPEKASSNDGKFLSSLVSKEQVALILEKQKEYSSNGAKVLLEAKVHELGPAFITPGIIEITDYDNDEEVFGPFLKIYRVKNLAEAIELANKTRYGLSAAIATESKENFEEFYNEINTGLINWNAPTTGAMGIAPFGGTGLSGNHRASGYYAADYCAYPVASVIATTS